jgi:hypothetical protein
MAGAPADAMTIRAKLYAAIVMTVLGPVVTIAVALGGMGALGDRLAEVEDRAARPALALELKFSVTDLNGWQTAYGYDGGRSRPQFLRSRAEVERDLAHARRSLTEPGETAVLRRLDGALRGFLELDDEAFAALRQGRTGRVREIFLGPEIERFQAMAAAAADLAAYEAARAAASRRTASAERRDVRRRLVAVALGAGVLMLLLLVTANDVARAALERRPEEGGGAAEPVRPPGG